ncbi:uncharacterized protein LOC116061918 isoform X1 [Sander lucioperca]|uniref:uncharacterized protein LOC116061918 isoform X1 n=2 Tax=Sander lucioperca TaxID=283035 RepID=UPI00125D77F3|nr:uncharacterized protein LOC116061918 isoform X1 [Sander lucioperca]
MPLAFFLLGPQCDKLWVKVYKCVWRFCSISPPTACPALSPKIHTSGSVYHFSQSDIALNLVCQMVSRDLIHEHINTEHAVAYIHLALNNRAIMLKRRKRIRPADDAVSYILSSRDKPLFKEIFIDSNKGRGVFASQPIEQGAFVLEYRGELLSKEDCQSRQYSDKQSTFLYEFQWQKRHWCIDASREDGSLGRLVNDNHKSPNCIMKKIIVNDRPHLCLFAVKNIEAGTEIDYNYGDSQWPWRKKVTSHQTETLPVDQTSHEDSDIDAATTQVTSHQTETLPVDQTSHEDSDIDAATTQVTSHQTETLPVDQTSHEDSDIDAATTQVTSHQTETLPVDQTSHEDSDIDAATTQVTSHQTETLPVDQTSHEDSDIDAATTQVTSHQTETLPVDQTSHEDSDIDAATTQMTSHQTETLPVDQTSHEDSDIDAATTQVCTVKGVSLVDYLLTDETDEDCIEDQPLTPHCDDIFGKQSRSENILMDRVSDFSEPLYDSNETKVEETDEEDSIIGHSSVQADGELVPKLRRTKSILVNKLLPNEAGHQRNVHACECIMMSQVPRKTDCQRCITAEPQALANRDWKAVKFFIKNRITALRRRKL